MRRFLRLEFQEWIAGIINPAFLAVQLWRLIEVQDSTSLSPIAFGAWLYMQTVFAVVGYRAKKWGLCCGMAVSTVITFIIIVLIFVYQK